MRYTSVHREEIDVKKKASHRWVRFKHLVLGLVFEVSFRPCWSGAQLRQLNGPRSIPSTLELEAHQNIVWCRLHREFKVVQVLELLSVCKYGPWDFVLVPYLFKVPVLEGIKQLRLRWSKRLFMNISEGKLLALVCTLAKMLCPTQLYVFSWPSSVFFLSLCFTVTFAIFFILFIVTALPMPGWKRCLSVFYCIILPFDLVMLNRMSYNVESAKSVLFFLQSMFKMSCVNTHINQKIKNALHG